MLTVDGLAESVPSKLKRPAVSVEGFSGSVIGIGSNACSKNSRMCGLIMVSSGMLCKVIHAKRLPFFVDVLPFPETEEAGDDVVLADPVGSNDAEAGVDSCCCKSSWIVLDS